jgi:phage tail tape-measure protein
MARSAIMSVRITGNSDDAVKAFSKVTGKAAAFGSFMGGMAVKGVTALWDKLKGFSAAVVDMSDSTDKFKQTMGFAGLDTTAIDQATKATRDYADRTVYDLTTVQNTTAQLAANGVKDYVGLTEAAGNLNAVAGGNADTFKSVAMVMTQTAGAGKLTTENWNQLTDAIPGAAGRIHGIHAQGRHIHRQFQGRRLEKARVTADEFSAAIMDLGIERRRQEPRPAPPPWREPWATSRPPWSAA